MLQNHPSVESIYWFHWFLTNEPLQILSSPYFSDIRNKVRTAFQNEFQTCAQTQLGYWGPSPQPLRWTILHQVDGFLTKIALATTYLPGRLQRKLPNNTLREKSK
jgi:hypothetical protein